jgi:L-threonylcarbamoyladenylate synthase
MVYYRQVEPVFSREQGMLGKPDIDLQGQVDKGIAILKQGGLVAFPTDTVYGLGACFSNLSAVERVYRVKQRLRKMGLPLLLAEEAQISEVAEYVPPVAWLLIGRFLPGALTIILPKSDSVPDIVTGGGKTVAIRIPAHLVPIALIKGIRSPIVGTSANVSGRPSSLTADEVCSQFGDEIDLVIDGGRCPGGRESTIIDITGETPRVLREGAISRQELEKVCDII